MKTETVEQTATELTEKLSKEFTTLLHSYLSVDELNTIREANTIEETANVCHTHDFLDANEVMAEAFKNVIGYEFEPIKPGADEFNTADVDLWNGAWDQSMAFNFYNVN